MKRESKSKGKSRRSSKRNSKKKLIISIYGILAVLVITTAGLVVTVSALGSKKEGIICEGIRVNGIDVGGKTEEQAEKIIADYAAKVQSKELVVSVTENGEVQGTESVSLKNLGVKAKSHNIVEEISKIGEVGNIIERYKEIKEAKENKPEYNLEFSYDSKKIDSFVKSVAKKYNIAPENATLTRTNGHFVVGGGKNGRSLNTKEAASIAKKDVKAYIESLPEGIDNTKKAEFTLDTKKPKYGREELSMVTDLLGTYTTRFNPAGGRGQNVANGCRLINGSVLMPGETLSANAKMAPYTLQNGYGMGTAYVEGKIVPDMGGGICQVSSTLYNAVLFSELGVLQRQNHSMSVDYVDLARDAAIAGTWKDLKFKNTTEYPIYIEGIANGGMITFNVYGHETRDVAHRKVELASVVLSRENGSRAQLYKYIYKDGVLTDKVLVNTSSYRPHEYEIEAAKKKAEEEKKKKEEEEKKKDEEQENKSSENNENKDKNTSPKKPTPSDGDDSEEGIKG